MFKKLVIAVAAVVTMTTSAGAFNMGATRSMKPQVIRSSTAPMAYQIFCARFASECAAGGRGSISYNSSTAALIKKVNDSVNRTMRYRSDQGEVWKIGSSSGDCEDFALTKRSRLIRAGLPAGALRMATATTSKGEAHAVLIVKTDKGEFVLDNIRKSVVRRSESGYTYNRIATADPRRWNPA